MYLQIELAASIFPLYTEHFRKQLQFADYALAGSGVVFPVLESTDNEWNSIQERRRRVETIMRDQVEVVAALGQGRYWDMYEALHQEPHTLIHFLDQEPYRIEYYWNTHATFDESEDAGPNKSNLATKFLPFCNIGRIVVGRLLRPDSFSHVFEHQLTPEESDIMLRSKQKFSDLWEIFIRHVGYGDFVPVFQPPSENASVTMPSEISSRHDWDDSSITMFDVSTNGDNVSQEDTQERLDSGVGIDEKGEEDVAIAVAGAEGNEEIVPAVNGHQLEDVDGVGTDGAEESSDSESASIALSNGDSQQDEGNGVLDENQGHTRSDSENLPTTNGHQDEGENHGVADENEGTSSVIVEKVPAVNGHSDNDENHITTNGNQDVSNEVTENAEELINTFGNLPDDGFEIAEQNPEIVAALQLVVALGSIIRREQAGDRHG
ncbi:uncharacterized protein LY89DRAFT_771422 [Mollisia scopiformis]|uniref:Uncharacterized protein n=1 Tax=Mollisia scopiformis TaxID=149040 RepID=A0A194XK39_MOLSC|nr:uncharacterized protein LY89DRAFT_771422 [Mollisia scopiformis]KUJ20506.1 hypothetical protein LY89DRAFT_771422 [Mollisia scopiformis]